jgi:beta-lactamase class A
MKKIPFAFLAACLGIVNCFAQYSDFRSQLKTLTTGFKATIGVAAVNIETGDTFTFNNYATYPMQSVYKFPQAVYVLYLVDQRKLNLNQPIRITEADVKPNTWSPIKQKYPKGNIELPLSEVLGYAISQSDNVACDVLFRLIGGPKKANDYIHQLGFMDMHLLYTEDQMHSDMSLQFKNSSSPLSMSLLFTRFYKQQYLSDSSTQFLFRLLTVTTTGPKRMKALLPAQTPIAHKTGTGGEDENNIRSACNDAGIITLPNGNHIALTVFVSRSAESFEQDEEIIAKLSEAVYRYYVGK